MAKWFKEFPINLKNGADRIRSVSESGSQPRANKGGLVLSIGTKTSSSKSLQHKTSSPDGGGVGSLLSGRNRKNSAADPSRSGSGSPKDGKVWESLLSGKSRKNSKADAQNEEQQRPVKSSPCANAYISRLIRVDKLDKSPNFNCSSITNKVAPEAEKPAQGKTETVSYTPSSQLFEKQQKIFCSAGCSDFLLLCQVFFFPLHIKMQKCSYFVCYSPERCV